MLPSQVLTVREVGDTARPYWTASSMDGSHLLLEDGETALWSGWSPVAEVRPQAWHLPDTTILVVTDRRTGFLTTEFDKGGGWAGFGVLGLAFAVSANVVSKHRAARRRAGNVAIGQVRHEWLSGITLRREKGLLGSAGYLDLKVATSTGIRTIEMSSPGCGDERFAHWLAGVVAWRRMALPGPWSPDEEQTFRRYQQGGHDALSPQRPNDLQWIFPGDVDALVGRTAPPTGGLFQPTVPPGWYANPARGPGAPEHRYWDGAAWTDRFDGQSGIG